MLKKFITTQHRKDLQWKYTKNMNYADKKLVQIIRAANNYLIDSQKFETP